MILTNEGITSLKKKIVFVLEVLVIVVFPSINIRFESHALWADILFVSATSIMESIILVVP